MESSIQGLHSSDLRVRLASAELLYEKLRLKSSIEYLEPDARSRVVSSCLILTEDSNIKLCMTGFDCLQTLIECQSESFQPYLERTFDLLIVKFSDIQRTVTARASDLMVSVINVLGLTDGFEKVTPLLSHKNHCVRDGALQTILKLHSLYGDDIMVMPDVCARVGKLLVDTNPSVCTAAVSCLVSLYDVFGESMLEELRNVTGLGSAEITAVQDAISYKNTHTHRPPTNAINSNSNNNNNSGATNGHYIGNGNINGNGIQTHDSQLTVFEVDSLDGMSLSPHPTHAMQMARTREIGTGRKVTSADSRLSVTTSVTVRNPSIQSPESISPKGGRSIGSSTFHPISFMGLLSEGVTPKGSKAYCEKDLGSCMESIWKGLSNSEDWNARITSLHALQALAVGDGGEFDSLLGHLKASHELISIQISDLRSVVCKEACRTVALLSRKMGHLFAPLAELWLPVLFKLLGLKIQVMSSAADRCVRIVMTCCPAGFAKVIPVLLEHSSNKIPILRKNVLEYFSLAAATWKVEILTKQLLLIKKMLLSLIGDADANVRRAARQLFWVFRSKNSQWNNAMDGLLSDLDAASQKHLTAEMQKPSEDLLELLNMIQSPHVLAMYDPYSPEYVPPSDSDVAEVFPNRKGGIPIGFGNIPPPPSIPPISPKKRIPSGGTVRGASPTPHSRDHTIGSTSAGVGGERRSLSCSRTVHPDNASNDFNNGNGHHGEVASSSSRGSGSAKQSSTMTLFRSNSASRDIRPKDTSASNFTERMQTVRGPSGISDRPGLGSRSASMGSDTPPISPLQAVNIRPSFSRLGIAGAGYQSSQGQDEDHDETPRGTDSDIHSNTGGDVGTARRVAPSVLGASRRSSLSGPQRIPPKPVREKDEDGDMGGGARRSTMNATLGGTKRSSVGGTGFNGAMTANQPNSNGIPLHTTRDRTSVRPPTLNATVAGDRDGVRLSQSGASGRPPMISTNSSSSISRAASLSSSSVPSTPPSPTAGSRRLVRSGSFSSIGTRGEMQNLGSEVPVWPSAGSITSLEAMRTACEDAHWSTRLKSFEVINELLTNALTSKTVGNDALGSPTSTSSSSRKESFTSIASNIEGIIDISVAHFGDAHQKVAVEAMTVLGVCVEGYSALSFGKLGVLLSALFNRLADRRAQIKDQANVLLNTARVTYEPNAIMTALSPRILDIPERMKTALMQFMGAIVSQCTPYFSQPHNTGAFLGRMANILGCSGSKPSVTLTVAGRRLLELLVKATPQVFLSQLSAMPFQQQSLLKRILEPSVPDIDAQVSLAGRNDWNRNSVDRDRIRISIRPDTYTSRRPSGLEQPSEIRGLDIEGNISSDSPLKILPLAKGDSPPFQPNTYTVEVPNLSGTPEGYHPHCSTTAALSPSPVTTAPTTPYSANSAHGNNFNETVNATATATANSSHVTPTKEKRLDDSTLEYAWDSPSEYQSPPVKNNDRMTSERDIARMLRGLGSASSSVEKAVAARELRHLVRTADDLYWAEHCPQIVSVLLEIFSQQNFYHKSIAEGNLGLDLENVNLYTRNSMTGFSPENHNLLQRELRNYSDNDDENSTNFNTGFYGSGTTVMGGDGEGSMESREGSKAIRQAESMHLACKALLLLVRHRGAHLKSFMNLMVSRLCTAATFAPMAITLHCEQILADLSRFDAPRFIRIALPYAISPRDGDPDSTDGNSECLGQSPQVCLLALRVIAEAIKHMGPSDLLLELPFIVHAVVPSMTSAVVDIRKAVVFVLVNSFLVVGDALYPFVSDLPASQKKLLHIYIEKHSSSSNK